AALASSRNALKEGGLIVLMEPGEGHEQAEVSQACAREYGLTERSMPPPALCAMLQRCGFRDLQIAPMFSTLAEFFREKPEQHTLKYRIIARMFGGHLATALKITRSIGKVAIISARR
ncbi:MAG TPA: hypothetical protein VLR94_02835, partial [Acidobacteriota bacterium]|nr:hypothetical protein [Acidobacteriota bacterium]